MAGAGARHSVETLIGRAAVERGMATRDQVLSAFEVLKAYPKEERAANFVKVFSSVGHALMVNPQLPGGAPSMFICGNDAGAKADVTALLTQFGWETEDLGSAVAARAIEPLCMLWCIPGFRQNDWVHAYKVLRPA